MTKRLKNPHLEKGFISILTDEEKPANKLPVIIKSEKGKFEQEYFLKATGYDELKGYLYFTAYEAGKEDTDKEFMKSEDLDFMLDNLMKNLTTTQIADHNHNMQALDGVYLNEIYKEKDKDGKTIAVKGVYNIKDSEVMMSKAKEGKITGVSIYGWVEDVIEEPLSKSENMIKDIWNKLFGKEEPIVISQKFETIEINKEADMKKELEEFIKSEDGLKELEAMGFKKETSEETPPVKTEEAPPKAPDPEIETLKSKIAELEKTAEDLKKENDALIMKRSTKPDEDADKKKEITKSDWLKMDAYDRHNLAIKNPELVKQFEEVTK